MRKISTHIKRWKKWRKHNINSKFYQCLVLIGFIHSPTLAITFTDEEYAEWNRKMDETLKGNECLSHAISRKTDEIFKGVR